MANVERNHSAARTEAVRPTTKRATMTAASTGLAIAGLRETIDGIEMRLDDVDERIAALELDEGAESPTDWEALARGALPKDVESVGGPIAPAVDAPEVGPLVTEGVPLTPRSLSEVQGPTPAGQAGQEPRRPAEVCVALSDAQFEKLFGVGSSSTPAVRRDTTVRVIDVSPSVVPRSPAEVREG